LDSCDTDLTPIAGHTALGVIAVVSREKFAFSPDGDLRALMNLAEACADQMARIKKPWWKKARKWLKKNISWLESFITFSINVIRKLVGMGT